MNEPSLGSFSRLGGKIYQKAKAVLDARLKTPTCCEVHYPVHPEIVKMEEGEGYDAGSEDFDYIRQTERYYALRVRSDTVEQFKGNGLYVVTVPFGLVADITPYLPSWNSNKCMIPGTLLVALDSFGPAMKVVRETFGADKVKFELVPVDMSLKVWKKKTHSVIFDPPKEEKSDARPDK